MAEQVEAEQEAYETPPEPEPDPDPDPDPDPEPEPEPEPALPAGIGPQELAKAERAIESQRKKLAGILGDEAVAHECFVCAGMGALPGLPPEGTRFEFVVTDDGPMLLGEEGPPAPQFKQATDKETCPECDGYGSTLTGGKPPATVTWACGKCNGAGWVSKTGAPPPPPPDFAPPAPGDVTHEPQPAGGVVDAWGREFGHVHWGVPPNMVRG